MLVWIDIWALLTCQFLSANKLPALSIVRTNKLLCTGAMDGIGEVAPGDDVTAARNTREARGKKSTTLDLLKDE